MIIVFRKSRMFQDRQEVLQGWCGQAAVRNEKKRMEKNRKGNERK